MFPTLCYLETSVFKVQGLGFRVFRVWGLGCLRFRVESCMLTILVVLVISVTVESLIMSLFP